MDIIPKKRERHVFELQLTAMIDIFSMIIIFLIKGTEFSSSDVPVPSDVKLPRSFSKETLDNAPSVVIKNSSIEAPFINQTFSLDRLRLGVDPSYYKSTLDSVKIFTQSIKPENKKSGVLLNVVADKNLPYSEVFDGIKPFREAGFDYVLFIAQGNGDSGGATQ